MNLIDLDRIKSKMRNQSVVDLDAYRAASGNTADTSATFVDPVTQRWLAIGIFLFCVFILFIRGR